MVQDVFVNLWSKAPGLDGNGNVRAYLYATLRNIILHELRTEANRTFYMHKLRQLKRVHESNKCLQVIYAKETETHIEQIINVLSPQCREAFRLSRYEQLSYKEIAERMHLSVSTVEKHIGKALRILREQLGKYENSLPFLLLTLFFF